MKLIWKGLIICGLLVACAFGVQAVPSVEKIEETSASYGVGNSDFACAFDGFSPSSGKTVTSIKVLLNICSDDGSGPDGSEMVQGFILTDTGDNMEIKWIGNAKPVKSTGIHDSQYVELLDDGAQLQMTPNDKIGYHVWTARAGTHVVHYTARDYATDTGEYWIDPSDITAAGGTLTPLRTFPMNPPECVSVTYI